MNVYDTPLTKTITHAFMKNPPQNVSERYTNNILRNGSNGLFDLLECNSKDSIVDGIVVGHYFQVHLAAVGSPYATGIGATPSQAVRRALEKFGVTFA